MGRGYSIHRVGVGVNCLLVIALLFGVSHAAVCVSSRVLDQEVIIHVRDLLASYMYIHKEVLLIEV